MKYLKTRKQLFENQPSYQNSPTGYKNSDVGYQVDMTSELEEDIIDYKIDYTNSYEVKNILDYLDVFTEFEPRFSIIINGKIIGGSTYSIEYIDDIKYYNFDIGILDGYQGKGISKKLISKIIEDANTLGCDYIKVDVINNNLSIYLEKIGFEISEGGDEYKKEAIYEL